MHSINPLDEYTRSLFSAQQQAQQSPYGGLLGLAGVIAVSAGVGAAQMQYTPGCLVPYPSSTAPTYLTGTDHAAFCDYCGLKHKADRRRCDGCGAPRSKP